MADLCEAKKGETSTRGGRFQASAWVCYRHGRQMSISKEDVVTVARLARLELDPQSAEEMTAELSKILAYVDQLAEVNTEGVPKTAHVIIDRAPLRKDVVLPGVSKLDALSQAPRCDETGFLVPGFVDES